MSNTNAQTYAATHCLGLRGISMATKDFNRVAHAAGVLAKAWRASGKDPSKAKPFLKLGESAGGYAVAVENDRSPEPVIQYFDSSFDALLEHLAPTITVMVHEGEIAPITRDPAKGDAYRTAFDQQQREREEAAAKSEIF